MSQPIDLDKIDLTTIRAEVVAYVDELRRELAYTQHERDIIRDNNDRLGDDYRALRAAAGKVTCKTCDGSGVSARYFIEPTRSLAQSTDCQDCANLRAILQPDSRSDPAPAPEVTP